MNSVDIQIFLLENNSEMDRRIHNLPISRIRNNRQVLLIYKKKEDAI